MTTRETRLFGVGGGHRDDFLVGDVGAEERRGALGDFEFPEEVFRSGGRPVGAERHSDAGRTRSFHVGGLAVSEEVAERRPDHGAAVGREDIEVLTLERGAVDADERLGDCPPVSDVKGQEMSARLVVASFGEVKE